MTLGRPVQLPHMSKHSCLTFDQCFIYNTLQAHCHPSLKLFVQIFISFIFMFLLLKTKSGHTTDAQEINAQFAVSMCNPVLQNLLSSEAGHPCLCPRS